MVRSMVPVPGSSGSNRVLAATSTSSTAAAVSAAVVPKTWATSPHRNDPTAIVPMNTRM